MKKNIEVDKYIANVPEKYKHLLAEFRENMIELLPEDAEEFIYYHMPAYKYRGRPFLVFAAFKNHCSLVTMRERIIKNLSKDLTGFKIAGTTIHFTPENPIPKEILKMIIEERIAG